MPNLISEKAPKPYYGEKTVSSMLLGKSGYLPAKN
jgi:hypothetical protein